MAVVEFDKTAFALRYPDFATVDPNLLAAYFAEAGDMCNNTDTSFITNAGQRSRILNMITAHIAELNTTPLVGRVGDVTVGGIPVHVDYAAAIGSRAWFDQTKYGAQAWLALSPFRHAFYIAP